MIRSDGAIICALIIGLFIPWGPSAVAEVQTEEDALLAKLLEISRVTQFRWSPQGNQIAYVSNSSGTAQIHLLTLGSEDSRQFTRHSSPVTDPQ